MNLKDIPKVNALKKRRDALLRMREVPKGAKYYLVAFDGSPGPKIGSVEVEPSGLFADAMDAQIKSVEDQLRAFGVTI